jgi:hypothetical protein
LREHLVVVLPGIGGSVLAPPGRPGEPVWSAGWSDRRLRHTPGLLAIDNVLEPVGLIKSLRPVPFWTALTGYEKLVASLEQTAGDPTVLPVGYDFRLGIVPAAQRLDDQVRQRLALLWPGADHTDRVIVVGHSMGGLVARYWIGPGGGADVCKALITMGTPHWGAPKALHIIANGIRVKGFEVLPRLRDVLRTWPGLVQLLPRYRTVVDARPQHLGGTGALWYPHDVPLPWKRWGVDPAAGYALHREIESAWERLERSSTVVVPRIGYGHGTLRGCSWDGERVSVTKDAPAWPDLGRWDAELGDGTVPAFAGLPVEMREPPDDFFIQSRHGHMAGSTAVAALVRRFEGRPDLRPYRGVEHPATLGLDLDELQAAGHAIEVEATVRGDGIPAAGEVWASVIQVDGTPTGIDVKLDFDSAGHHHHGELPGLAAGTYTVRFLARAHPGAGDLTSEQTIEVFDDADLA